MTPEESDFEDVQRNGASGSGLAKSTPAAITYDVALPLVRTEDGELTPGEPVEALNEWQARSRASGLAIHNPGAVAFSRTGDPSSGDFEPAVVIARHGKLPEDLESIMAGEER